MAPRPDRALGVKMPKTPQEDVEKEDAASEKNEHGKSENTENSTPEASSKPPTSGDDAKQ